MKKIMLLLLLLLFITGCSANYDIEIYNDQVKESMSFINTDSSTWDSKVQYDLTYRELLSSSVNYPYPVSINANIDENDMIKIDGVEYYNNTLISDNYQLGQKLEYKKFTLDNFNESSIIRECYQYFNIIEEENSIILSTSTENLCFHKYPLLDNITINLKTNHKVVNSNASSVNGYHYTWNIPKEATDASISITIKKDEYIFNYENEFVKKVVYIIVIVGIILSVSSITYLYLKNKRKRSDEI